LPEAYFVAPSTVPSGSDAQVKVTGRGFSQLPAGNGFKLSGATIAQVNVVSDTEAWLTVAAPTAGGHTLSLWNAAGIATAAPQVVAAKASAANSQVLVPDTGAKSLAVLDESRGAVFAYNYASGLLQRYRRDSGGAWTTTSLALSGGASLGLSPDGKSLLMTKRDSLVLIDPDTLLPTAEYVPSSDLAESLSPPYMASTRIPFTNDGRAWFTSNTQWGIPVAFNFAHRAFEDALPSSSYYGAVPFATPDGGTLYIEQWGITGGGTSAYAEAAGVFASRPLATPDIEAPSFSADGSLIVGAQLGLYDPEGTPVGSLQGSNWLLPVPSPDGLRVYQMGTVGGSDCNDHLDVYDTSTVGPSGPPLVPFATIPVTARADSCGADPYYTAWSSSLIVDARGETVYWVGDKGLLVVPVPASLRPAVARAATVSHVPSRLQPAAGVQTRSRPGAIR
jgi:hypothetical protein